MAVDLITKAGSPMSSGNFMRLMKSILSDGKLDGCGITASGASITVAAGRIVAGGALVVIESTTTVTASAAGELVLRIDTSGEGTASILARTAVTLTKQDITGAGTVYEVQIATFGFTSGAVTNLSIKIGAAAPIGASGRGIYVQQSAPSSPSTGDLWFW